MEGKGDKLAFKKKLQSVSVLIPVLKKDLLVKQGKNEFMTSSFASMKREVKKAEFEVGLYSEFASAKRDSSEIVKVIVPNESGSCYESVKYVDNLVVSVSITDLETGYSEIYSTCIKSVDFADMGVDRAISSGIKVIWRGVYNIEDEQPEQECVKEEVKGLSVEEEKQIALDFLRKNKKKANDVMRGYGVEKLSDLTGAELLEVYGLLVSLGKVEV